MRRIVTVNNWNSGGHCLPRRKSETLSTTQKKQSIPQLIECGHILWGQTRPGRTTLRVVDITAGCDVVEFLKKFDWPWVIGSVSRHVKPKEDIVDRCGKTCVPRTTIWTSIIPCSGF